MIDNAPDIRVTTTKSLFKAKYGNSIRYFNSLFAHLKSNPWPSNNEATTINPESTIRTQIFQLEHFFFID